MSDSPERIWYIAYGDFRETPSDRADDVEYIRKDIADAAVRAERERMKPFADTAQRFHRRMQLLEGF